MKFIKILALFLICISCTQEVAHEDVILMKNIAAEQQQSNDQFVSSLRAQLEYYGAHGDEARYYENSTDILTMRNRLLRERSKEGIKTLSDSLDNRMKVMTRNYNNYIQWTAEDEHLASFYFTRINERFDSVTFYKLLYLNFKKEYALHTINAQMMAH